MYKNKRILAIIPARGGSKGVPAKNIKTLNGKPLIAYTIENAKACNYIDKTFVSTDCLDISAVAEKFGIKVPILRPNELAQDSSSSVDVVLHALDYFKTLGENFEVIVLLQATSPLRSLDDIEKAIDYFFKKQANTVVSVCECAHHPFWANTLPEDMSLSNFIKDEVKNKNRQQLPTHYEFNGAIYIANTEFFRKNKGFIGEKSYAYVMPKERSIDLDTYYDFKLAEFILSSTD